MGVIVVIVVIVIVVIVVVTGGKQSQLLALALGFGWSLTISQSLTTIKYLLWLICLILVVFFMLLEQKNSVAH